MLQGEQMTERRARVAQIVRRGSPAWGASVLQQAGPGPADANAPTTTFMAGFYLLGHGCVLCVPSGSKMTAMLVCSMHTAPRVRLRILYLADSDRCSSTAVAYLISKTIRVALFNSLKISSTTLIFFGWAKGKKYPLVVHCVENERHGMTNGVRLITPCPPRER